MPAVALAAKFHRYNGTLWTTRLITIGAIVLGLLHTFAAASSYSMNADGINYLDIGDAYWQGDWEAAINPVWSPLYSWILGGVMRLFQPAMRWEFPLVHVVNFAIYLSALASFAVFWKQVGIFRNVRLADGNTKGELSLPDWAFNAVGYLLFTWSSLTLIEIWAVTPDMLMAAIVYLAGALILHMRVQAPGWKTFAILGFLLGLGYLAKTIMLPVALLFFAASLFSAGGLRRLIPRFFSALLVFGLIAGPYITLISSAKGRFTYGESGPVTYMRYVNHVPYPHWQGETAGHGTPIHPSRQIFSDPPVYEFGSPIHGTYPISYDPSYWYEGIQLTYSLREIFPSLLSSSLVYFDLFFNKLGPLLASILILYLISPIKRRSIMTYAGNWNLALISIPVLVLYSLVYVEGRYVAVFVVLFMSDLLANLSLPDGQAYKKLVQAASLVMIFSLLASLLASNLEGFNQLTSRAGQSASVQPSAPPPSWPGEVAEELQRLGIRPGDKVAVIGYAFDSFWARLARVKIVAEMLVTDAAPFWFGSPELQDRVIQAFHSTGVRAIVAEETPAHALLRDWHRVGDSNVYIYVFHE